MGFYLASTLESCSFMEQASSAGLPGLTWGEHIGGIWKSTAAFLPEHPNNEI